jgi:hypothetical protein
LVWTMDTSIYIKTMNDDDDVDDVKDNGAPSSPQRQEEKEKVTELRPTPPRMGQHLLNCDGIDTLSDFGIWMKETLFGFRINCAPPEPEMLTTLLAIRARSDNCCEVLYHILDKGIKKISLDSLSRTADLLSPPLLTLQLRQAEGLREVHSSPIYSSPPPPKSSQSRKRKKGKQAVRKFQSLNGQDVADSEEEEGDDSDSEEEEELGQRGKVVCPLGVGSHL